MAVSRALPILAVAAGLVHADLAWNFAQVDSRPGGTGGVYAYAYPSDSSGKHSSAHTAALSRVEDASGHAALLHFVLDGARYPSAGFALMFSETQPLDLRGLTGIRLHLSSDRARKVRISLTSRIPAYKAAFDTGVSLGRDIRSTPSGTLVELGPEDLTWPPWATDADIPNVGDLDVLATTWAIQLNISCEESSGKCDQDSGWLRLDSLRLLGVGTDWLAPGEGDCTGDSVSFSDFSGPVPKRDGLGGWWYAYTDANSSDTSARGFSRILSAPDTTDPSSWGPDSAGNRAHAAFRLVKGGSYSGYADIEAQLHAPDPADRPVATNLPGLKAISFDLAFDPDFPSSLGGITFHAKKAGKLFSGGKDHQIRLPFLAQPRRWCIDFDSLAQPAWTSWVPFSSDSLLALNWEVKLQDNSAEASGGFSLSGVKLWSSSVGVKLRPTGGWSIRRLGDFVELVRPYASSHESVRVELLDASGRVAASRHADPGSTLIRLPSPASRMLWARISGHSGIKAIPVPPGFGR